MRSKPDSTHAHRSRFSAQEEPSAEFPGIDPGRLYSTAELAEVTGLSVAAYEAWRFRNDDCGPPFIHLGRAVRYAGSDIVAWLNKNKTS